jgi:hypothetical protein
MILNHSNGEQILEVVLLVHELVEKQRVAAHVRENLTRIVVHTIWQLRQTLRKNKEFKYFKQENVE